MDSLIKLSPVLEITFLPQADELKLEALVKAESIVKVDSADDQPVAVAAQVSLKSVLDMAKKSGREIKDVINAKWDAVDKAQKKFTNDLEIEYDRISKLIADFHQNELAKQKSEQSKSNGELTELEREREKALASSKSLIEREVIQALFDQKVRAVEQPEPIAKVKGQSIREEWEIVSIQDFVLYSKRPDLATSINWDKRAIKQQLDRGVTLPGVEARQVVKASVRVTTQKAIEV